MICFSLACASGHDFEGWFRSSADFDDQSGRGHVACPVCGSLSIGKALMAPAVHGTHPEPAPTTALVTTDPNALALQEQMRALRAHILATTDDVGASFPEEARRIHFGEVEHRAIRGQATPQEARALREEGVDFAPVPLPLDEAN